MKLPDLEKFSDLRIVHMHRVGGRLFVLFASLCLTILMYPLHATQAPVWPTSSTAFIEGKAWESFIQPTESGHPVSGLFGSTRSRGARFHEGIDIRAEERDSEGRARDRIYAFLPGVIVHVNQAEQQSSYGKYLVIEHRTETLPVYSLYSHLSVIDAQVEVGKWVESGALLGIMGATAGGYDIPLERAHLHFEIGLRLSDRFNDWYATQEFDTSNDHGLWNGMNLIGFNPLSYFGHIRVHGLVPMHEYVKQHLKTDFTLRVFTAKIPDFVLRYPALLSQPIPRGGVGGWEIDFTWYGLPKAWKPLHADPRMQREGYEVIRYDASPMLEQKGRQTLVKTSEGVLELGIHLKQFLEILFAGTP